MRPIFEYDPVRGALLVRLDVSEEYGRPERTLFAVNGDPMDNLVCGAGAEPPLYLPPIPDAALFEMLEVTDTRLVPEVAEWVRGGCRIEGPTKAEDDRELSPLDRLIREGPMSARVFEGKGGGIVYGVPASAGYWICTGLDDSHPTVESKFGERCGACGLPSPSADAT